MILNKFQDGKYCDLDKADLVFRACDFAFFYAKLQVRDFINLEITVETSFLGKIFHIRMTKRVCDLKRNVDCAKFQSRILFDPSIILIDIYMKFYGQFKSISVVLTSVCGVKEI